jgi:hypothetical protein
MIIVTVFELIIYAAFNLCWIKHKYADFGFMITYVLSIYNSIQSDYT